MNNYNTKVWRNEWNHTENGIFKAIAYKERLYHELLYYWIKKYPDFTWNYNIKIGENKVFLEIELTNDPAKTSKRDIEKDS